MDSVKNKCRCPENVQRATKLIGIFNVIFSTAIIASSCLSLLIPQLKIIPLLFTYPTGCLLMIRGNDVYTFEGLIVLIVSFAICIPFSILLYFGAQRRLFTYLKIFFVYGNISVLFAVCYSLFWTWNDISDIFDNDKEATLVGLVFHIPVYLFYAIISWELYIVYKCMDKFSSVIFHKELIEDLDRAI